MKGRIEADQLDRLLAQAKVIEKDGLGIKVAALADGRFLKLFRRKRGLSSDLWLSSAQRFADNARGLHGRGIAAPEVTDVFSVPERRLDAIIYHPLPGETLRQHLRQTSATEQAALVTEFGAFLGDLHQRGVYFRSLHLGNVLRLPDRRFALIDLSDMHLEKQPLSAWKRRRNLHHILRYQEDIDWLARDHRGPWLDGYARSGGAKYIRQFARDVAAFKLLTQARP